MSRLALRASDFRAALVRASLMERWAVVETSKERVPGLVARETKLRPEGRFYRLRIYHDEAAAEPIRGQSQAHVWKGLSGRTTIDLRKLMSVGMDGSWPKKKGRT